LKNQLAEGKLNPRDAKINLAKIFVERFHSKKDAEASATEFLEIFSNKGVPTDIPEWKTPAVSDIWICKLMVDAGVSLTTSEARRLVEGGGVERDGTKVSDS